MRPVIVGIDGGRNGPVPLDPAYPSGARLAELCGLSPSGFVERTDRVNLLGQPENLRPILRGRRVLLLGREVSSRLGITNGDMFMWTLGQECVAAQVPHPSGRSRWWNSRENWERAREFLLRLSRPCIHVEGTDGSGKSTLARRISEMTGAELVPTEDPPRSWEECLRRIEVRVRPGTVCDRSSGLLSELVYGPVIRRRTVAPEPVIWRAVQAVVHAVVFVYCRPPDELVRPSFRREEDREHVRAVRERRSQLASRYDDVMARVSALGARVVVYDRSRQGPEEVMECVE